MSAFYINKLVLIKTNYLAIYLNLIINKGPLFLKFALGTVELRQV